MPSTPPPDRRGRSRAVRALGLALALAVTTRAEAQINFNTFVSGGSLAGLLSNTATIGFAYAGDKFVGSVYFGPNNNQLYSVDLTGNNIQKFGAPIPIGGSGEMYVSSSLGLGGFAARNVFAGFENVGSIAQVANDGSTTALFASGLVGGVRSIAFDPYGLYGYDMIVATNAGRIYRINNAGVATQIANVGEDAEGLSFAPQTFGPYAKGTLVVASEGSGSLRAIAPNGTMTLVATVPSAEMVSFVPLNLGSSGSPVEGFYAANYPFNIVKADASQFTSYLGDMFVTSETGHFISDIRWDATLNQFVRTDLTLTGAFNNQPEDGIFVTADVINSTTPEPATLALLVPGLLAVGAMARRRKK